MRNHRNFIGVLISIIILAFIYHLANKDSYKIDLLNYAHEIGNEISDSLYVEISKTKYCVDSIAEIIKKTKGEIFCDSINKSNKGKISYDSIIKLIKGILLSRKYLNDVFIAFEDHKDEKKHLFSPYIRRVDSKYITTQIHDEYNYITDTIKAPWFHIPKKAKKACLLAPTYGYVASKRFICYTVPISLSDSSFCVLGIDYSSMNIYHLLHKWKAGRIGYPYLINNKGEFISHPENETKTLNSIARIFNDSVLVRLSNDIKSRENLNTHRYYHNNTVSKENCWEEIFEVKLKNWLLGISVTDQQIYRNPNKINEIRKDKIIYSFIFCIILLILLRFIKNIILNKNIITADIFIVCLVMFIQIISIYQISLKFPLYKSSKIQQNETSKWNSSMLLDKDCVNKYTRLFLSKNKQNIEIPTGLYLQTVKFSDSKSTNITGYIWQKYDSKYYKKKGIVFPDAEKSDIKLICEKTIILPNGEKAIYCYWHFKVSIIEQFNYKLYPFDINDLWLRICNANFDENFVLVPDFDAYTLLHPSFKPGLDNSIEISGWKIEGTYFSYKNKSYNTNFGMNQYFTKSNFPELHYNIRLKRDYIDPIIARIIPLIVLIFMIYSILLIGEKKDVLNIAIACSGLLFVAVFEHVSLRKSLNTSGIIYLEYYYFMTYLLLLLVSISATLSKVNIKIKSNYINCYSLTKYIYWPLAILLILIITSYTYY